MSGRYLPYAHYKPSPVPWQEMLPSHWASKPLKHLCHFHGGGTPSKDNNGYWSGDIPWVSPKDMKRKFIDSTEDHITAQAVENSSTKLIDERALLIVVRSGILQHSIPSAINTKKVTLNQDMKALIFGKYMEAEYAYYFVEGNQSDLLLDWSKQGATVESIEQEYLANAIWPTPPIDEQRSIANFLDHETAKIDTLIDKQQQLIKLLKEKRQAVISHAVTKGLNPDAPMKDSGVEWLGEVPEHWGVSPLRYVTDEVTVGIVITPAKYYADEGVPCFRSLNVREGYLKENDFVYISPIRNDELSKSKVFKGDILVVRTGQPGTAAVVTSKYDGVNCIDLIILRKNKLFYSSYICHQINSDVCKRQILSGSGGAIQQHFNVETAKGLYVALPPIEEQNQIAEHIKQQCMKYDLAIGNAERFVQLSKERRIALISAAVTGKIDVRNWRPEQSESRLEAMS